MPRRGLLLIALITACSGSGAVHVADAWAGTTPPNAETAAIYLSISNETSKAAHVLSVTSEHCGSTEIHESKLDDQQVMRMRPADADALTVGSGETLEMRPGALHVMCIDLTEPFEDGDTFGYSVAFGDGSTISGEGTVENR